ncbi:MAG TPA: PQQ-binding-like beta-propeller repeat protein [Polyangia bacterium]
MKTASEAVSWHRLGLVAILCFGCAGATARRQDPPTREYPAGVTRVLWRTPIHERGLFEPRSEECASGAIVGDRLIIGSRAGRAVALALSDGRQLWSTPVTGNVDSETRYDPTHKQAYLGTDDGFIYALDPAGGQIRWSYKTRGAVERRPELGGDAVYFSTTSDRVVALDPRTGKAVWQYEREAPEGFTIHGHAGPRLAQGFIYAGFSDGYLVSLNAGTGDVVWARSLASASEQYVDVDSTPALLGPDLLLAASYSGGLYALATNSGDVRWRVNVEGASAVQVIDKHLFFAAPRDGLTALTDTGEVLWRQGLADAGDLSPPFAVGSALVFSGSRSGLFFVDRASGRLLEIFNPGRGMCAPATVAPDGQTLYILANSGSVYAVALSL